MPQKIGMRAMHSNVRCLSMTSHFEGDPPRVVESSRTARELQAKETWRLFLSEYWREQGLLSYKSLVLFKPFGEY